MRSATSAAVLVLAGCSSFGTVRSAEVHPGGSVGVQASVSTPPGDQAAWFWSYDCVSDCDHRIPGGDLGFTYGVARERGGAFALGVGINGIQPYADGYVQLREGDRPFGVGARVGVPLDGWQQHQLYGRYDVRLGSSRGVSRRLLLNPALFVHYNSSRHSFAASGSFVGFVQGVGLLLEREGASLVPAVTLVAGRSRRRNAFEENGAANTVFGVASLGIVFHRARR